jgi:hypothetical protein
MGKPIICYREDSLRRQGSKGLSRHKPTGLLRTAHLFHVPLTALPSSAFGCLTEDHLNAYALLNYIVIGVQDF